MSPTPQPLETMLRRVDRRIWWACAGTSVQVPAVNARVYYFPQGHMEHSASPPSLSPPSLSKPFIICRVAAVDFLADSVTDEVFTKLVLHPVSSNRGGNFGEEEKSNADDDDDDDDEGKIVSFTKILTTSDANNGGGFSVPRYCADSIFPSLDFRAETPLQSLKVTDLHGVVWEFRHIYRGTPRRHLLTTGWSKFVNHKKLVAGDSVVFMRNLRGEMFIGVRRVTKSNPSVDYAKWREQISGFRVNVEKVNYGFSWSGKGKLSAESVAKAIELAAQGLPFEVVYYPKAGRPEFVVKAEMVEESMNVFWTAGMRVKMALETEDSSRMTWFQGTVSSATFGGNGAWQGSPWRMLQVIWDEPKVLLDAKRVSPWQVDLVEPTPPLHFAFNPAKKLRVPMSSGGGEVLFPMMGFANSTMGHLSPTLLNYNSFPAGMQGARQYSFHVSSLSDLITANTPKMRFGNYLGKNTLPELKSVSNELSIGDASTNIRNSMQSSAMEVAANRSCSSGKAGIHSFQLFGKIIHLEQAIESPLADETDGCAEDEVTKEYNENGGLCNRLDLSLTSPCAKLVDGLDVQC